MELVSHYPSMPWTLPEVMKGAADGFKYLKGRKGTSFTLRSSGEEGFYTDDGKKAGVSIVVSGQPR